MNRYALAPAAFATLLALAGCDLSEPAVGKPETRDFAPRLHEIPVSEIVRLEVSSTDLSNFQGSTKPQSGFYQTFQVQYSSRRISANGIPTGKLYFRLSGLDQSQTPIWVVNKPIPDVPEPVVEIGTTAENSPRIIGIPTITIPSGANYPLITCPYGTPAWTIDGNQPPSANNSSTRYQTGDPVQSNVQLGSGQTLTARCTDRIVWSTSTTYKFTGPNNQPNPSGPGGYFGNKVPVLAIPSGPSGQIEMSINASDTLSFTSYSHWKIAFKFDQGSWSTLTSPGSVPYSSTGMITAYLMAWDGTEWRSGQSVQAAYPKFQVIPPGGPLPIPSVSVYNPIGGTGTSEASINAFASGLSYSGWKAMYRLSGGDTAWKSIEMPLNQSAASSSLYANLQGITGSGTISVYLLAYSSSSQNWVSSPVTTAIYPAASAIGPGTSFPAPQIIPPSGGMGSVTYSFDIATYPEFSNWNVVTKVNAEQPSIQNLSTAASYISGTGTMTAYLVAWSGSAWVAGEAVSKSYPPQPDSAAANGPGTELSQVVIQSPESVPGMVRFSDPGMVTCPSCMNWKVAYKTGSNTTWKIADLSTGVSVRDTSIIDAYLMAWSTNNYKWLYGPTASAKYPDVPTPPVVLPPNGSAMSLNINLPTTLPNPITFSRGAQVSYSHWMVTYKTNEMTEWRLIPLDSSVYMETNGTIYYYPMAWDASSKRWITGSQMYSTVTGGQSINNPEIVPPGGPLAAPVIHGKSSLPSDIPFSLKLTAMDSATYSSGSWKIVYQVNGMGSWSLIEASSTAYVINYGPSTTLRAYVQAWNPTTKRWVSGKDTSISLP
ncbi:MAG: hypothetical protein RL173_890, partial [Fibrobacterota bacterium]